MTIKQYGGVFGRNPTFNDVTIEGQLTFDGDIDINSDLKVSGDIETTGNVIIGTSGKGIDFSATAGTGTSELFDDYEEGTWTPVLTTDGTNFTSVSYIIQAGTYTKIGNRVICDATIYTSAITKGSASGNVVISGLPFTAAFSSARASINVGTSFSWATNNPTGGEIPDSNTIIYLNTRLTSNGGTTNVVVSDVGTGSNNFIRVSSSYFV
jgi:hypothetical protein